MDDSIVAGAAIVISFLTLVGSAISFLLSRDKTKADTESVFVGMASDLTGDALALVEALTKRVGALESDLVAERTARQLGEEKIDELEERVKVIEGEKAELSEENDRLVSANEELVGKMEILLVSLRQGDRDDESRK